MKERVVLDASVITSVVNSDDAFHQPCYQYFRDRHDAGDVIWVIPGLIMFEFQATQSRRYRERRPGQPVYRDSPLYVDQCEVFQVTKDFLWAVSEAKLYDLFAQLRGADLLYACIAKLERIPLVTHDKGFERYASELKLINPCEL